MNEKGGKFGEGVALIHSLLGLQGLIVGAPGVDKVNGDRKDTDYGKAFAYDSSFAAPAAFATGQGKEEALGWQVAADGPEVFVATKWSGEDRRVEVYSAGPTRILAPPLGVLPNGMGDGWASGGIFTGSVGNEPSVLIGAPNANCAGEGSSGAAYLYVGASTAPEIFVPPVPVDASGDTWNAFGWSADIVTAGGFDYVIIGEPGREYPSGDDKDKEGKVYVYQTPLLPPAP